jgi:hypothetical protein
VTHQFDIFVADVPRHRADPPRAARNDPTTSHIAAREVRDSGQLNIQQSAVGTFVRMHPGKTSAELARLYAQRKGGTWQQYRPMFGRRLGELASDIAAVLRRGEKRNCDVTGRLCETWWPR